MNRISATTEDLRRALEALRNGVPNRDAVRVLGSGQEHVTDKFQLQLAAVEEDARSGKQAKGMLIAGDFGTGKSHVLEHLKNTALENNMVCSLIVISKETPLFDPAKLFASGSETAVAPGVTGDAIREIALRLDPRADSYRDFLKWVDDPENGISTFFAASLQIHERLGHDSEMSEHIRGFWAGEHLPIAELRVGLRLAGLGTAYQLRTVPAKELPIERFRFVSGLIRAAGFKGWMLLIDEIELVYVYSRLQRAKSYAELARWMGEVENSQFPGLSMVGAITEDFEIRVLREKGDREFVVPLLESKDTDDFRALASRAETGMRLIERDLVSLTQPDSNSLRSTHDTLKQIHAQAYDWEPLDLISSVTETSRSMRSYVRRWINEWDLHRLYPGETLETVETEVRIDYTENLDFEFASEVTSDAYTSER